jgi:hypothetical protein
MVRVVDGVRKLVRMLLEPERAEEVVLREVELRRRRQVLGSIP